MRDGMGGGGRVIKHQNAKPGEKRMTALRKSKSKWGHARGNK